jgi:hypothetical protein
MEQTANNRAESLLEAQRKAQTLFHEVEVRGIIRPGAMESVINEEIYALAQQMYGVTQYWHKRIVRAGSNKLLPYDENPPDLVVQGDDVRYSSILDLFLKPGRPTLAARLCSATIRSSTNYAVMSKPRSPRARGTSNQALTSPPKSCTSTPSRWRKRLAGNSAGQSPDT